jgi:DNA (cytosine-5)-methyltransferase 1
MDSPEEWNDALRECAVKLRKRSTSESLRQYLATLDLDGAANLQAGSNFVPWRKKPKFRSDWYVDPELGGVCNHVSRFHLRSDIQRYFFVSAFAASMHEMARSPKLVDFPTFLLPNHQNVQEALDGAMFGDRFRVQVAGRPSTTVTSHISKDGHYYIHPNPLQARSLTVREVARIQTFPDNYFFCGPRTSQYHQVGNAVPPLLAWEIAAVVAGVLTG